jgi:hypothetical protein
MAAEIVRQEILAARRQEYVVLMDDYGAELHFAIPVSFTAAQRTAEIAAKTAQHSASQAQLEAYAASASIDLTAQKTAGQQKRVAAQKAKGITPAA